MYAQAEGGMNKIKPATRQFFFANIVRKLKRPECEYAFFRFSPFRGACVCVCHDEIDAPRRERKREWWLFGTLNKAGVRFALFHASIPRGKRMPKQKKNDPTHRGAAGIESPIFAGRPTGERCEGARNQKCSRIIAVVRLLLHVCFDSLSISRSAFFSGSGASGLREINREPARATPAFSRVAHPFCSTLRLRGALTQRGLEIRAESRSRCVYWSFAWFGRLLVVRPVDGED